MTSQSTPTLPDEIAALIRTGSVKEAVAALRDQRRITLEQALALVKQWRDAHGF